MINCVKSFLQVNKYAACKVLVIKVSSDLFNNAEKCMISGIFLPKAKLILINNVVFIKEVLNAVVHDPFEYLPMLERSEIGL